MRRSSVAGAAGAALLLLAVTSAAAAPPWRQALRFRPLPAWHTGSSSARILGHAASTAWIANVRYRDRTTADPPARTVHRMRPDGIVVWAGIWAETRAGTWKPLDLRLARFHRGLCCDGTGRPYTRVWDTGGRVSAGGYDAVVRVYFGSRPTAVMLRQARRALRALVLPPRRSG